MKVIDALNIIDNPNAEIALYKFGGLQPRHFFPVGEAKERFSGYLNEEVLTIYNGTWFSSSDRTSVNTYFIKPNTVVIEYK